MRVLLQRVDDASVVVDEKVVASIQKGILAFVGFHPQDSEKELIQSADKLVHLRIFPDEQNKMNLSLKKIKGELLVVSQFTLYGNLKSGNRPSFTQSAPFDLAQELYEKWLMILKQRISKVQQGVFGAHMEVQLKNNGPVTFFIEFSPEETA